MGHLFGDEAEFDQSKEGEGEAVSANQ